MRKCTSLAPASRIMRTIFTEVVPRTRQSSISTMRLPATTARLALCFSAHAELADRLGRLDEGAADIVVADDAELEGNAGGLGVAERRRHAAVGHRHHHVGVGRRLAGELAAHALADLVDAAAADDGVRPGEVDVFEDAGARRHRRERLERLRALLGIDDDLAVLDVAHVARADDVERAGLRGQDRAAVELAQHQRADAERVARADQLLVGQRDQRVGALDLAQRVDEAVDEAVAAASARSGAGSPRCRWSTA